MIAACRSDRYQIVAASAPIAAGRGEAPLHGRSGLAYSAKSV
jgi:hypothetical protein